MGSSAGMFILADGIDSIFFEDAEGATEVQVICDVGTANINVPELHVDGEYLPIEAGFSRTFRLNHMGIKKIIGQGDGAAATIRYAALSKTS